MIYRLNAMIVEMALYMPERAKARLMSLKNQDGQAFVEYALLLTVVAIAVALLQAWTDFVGSITTALGKIGNVIKDPTK
jgi:Flp pilus assembly pilin Flp